MEFYIDFKETGMISNGLILIAAEPQVKFTKV